MVVRNSGYNYYSGSISGDSRQPVSWDGGASGARAIEDESWSADGYANVIIKPRENLRISIGPSYSRSTEPKQFITNRTDSTAVAFGGLRSVFGNIDQTSLSMNTRVNATFTPTLTLELFAQPFLASGHYTDFAEFAAPRSGELRIYGSDVGSRRDSLVNGRLVQSTIDPDGTGRAAFTLDNPDFNFRSLRGTAVLRWEYRPGSTLFFVWSQQREGSDGFGTLDFRRERAALFRDPATNVFQIKASYWLGI